MKHIKLNFDEDLLKRIDQIANDLKITRAAFIRKSIQYYLEQLKIEQLEKNIEMDTSTSRFKQMSLMPVKTVESGLIGNENPINSKKMFPTLEGSGTPARRTAPAVIGQKPFKAL